MCRRPVLARRLTEERLGPYFVLRRRNHADTKGTHRRRTHPGDPRSRSSGPGANSLEPSGGHRASRVRSFGSRVLAAHRGVAGRNTISDQPLRWAPGSILNLSVRASEVPSAAVTCFLRAVQRLSSGPPNWCSEKVRGRERNLACTLPHQLVAASNDVRRVAAVIEVPA
jgi:hypothetical protein